MSTGLAGGTGTAPIDFGDDFGDAIVFHVGVFGPTARAKLQRIARVCEVPSVFLTSAFDLVDHDHDGMIDEVIIIIIIIIASVRACAGHAVVRRRARASSRAPSLASARQ